MRWKAASSVEGVNLDITVFKVNHGERGVGISPEELTLTASTGCSCRIYFLMEIDKLFSN